MTDIKVQYIKKSLPGILIIIFLAPLLFMNCDKKKVIDKKQIILISIDTLRGDHLSSYGYFRDTSPHLSNLTRDSVYYINTYPNGCWTMPSHMSLLTGTLPSRHGINKDWKSIINKKYPQLNDSIKTIPEALKFHHITTIKFAQLPPALGFSKGFDKNNQCDPFLDDIKFNKLLKELENHKEKDFFLFIHTWMVHAPYANSYFLKEGKIDKDKGDYIDNFRRLNRQKGALPTLKAFRDFLKKNNLFNVNDCVALYDSGIRYVDQYIGKIIRKTKQLGIYEQLMLIVVSDHGEHFNEHFPGRFHDYHGKDFYEEFIKVPLIIKYPFQFKSGTINHPVSLIDVFPTILDYYETEIPPFVQGNSLLTSYSKRKTQYIISEAISLSKTERKMIRVGDLKYIIKMNNPSQPGRVNWNLITERRLFDLKQDPEEKNNLYNHLKFRQICIDFEKLLTRIIKNSAKTNQRVKETSISKETVKQLEALGYL